MFQICLSAVLCLSSCGMKTAQFISTVSRLYPDISECDEKTKNKILRRRRNLFAHTSILMLTSLLLYFTFVPQIGIGKLSLPIMEFTFGYNGIISYLSLCVNILYVTLATYFELYPILLSMHSYIYLSGVLDIKFSIIFNVLNKEENENVIYRNLCDLVDTINFLVR